MDPIFWLGASILLVAVSIAVVLAVAVPAIQELGRAARSAEKLFDTLNRELPPTLEAIRLTGLEISDLTDDMSEGVQNASQVAKQVDDGISGLKEQAQKAQVTTISLFAGVKAAWQTWTDAEKTPNAAKNATNNPDAAKKPNAPEIEDFSISTPPNRPPELSSSRPAARRQLRSPTPQTQSAPSPTSSPTSPPPDQSTLESALEDEYL